MAIEEFRPIDGFYGIYEVSNHGRVKSLKTSKPRIIKLSGIRYLQVNLSLNGKFFSKRVNRLVLEAFVGPAMPGMEAAHLNGNRKDNRVENLKWCSRRHNRAHEYEYNRGASVGGNKLNDREAKMVRILRKENFTYEQLADAFGINTNSIYKIIKNKTHV